MSMEVKVQSKKVVPTHTQAELHIGGMDCAECAKGIETRLSQLEGVRQVQVLLGAEKGLVTYDPQRVRPEQMTTTISAMGYQARVVGVDDRERDRDFASLANGIRLVFLAVVGLLALLEILAEKFGLADAALTWVPAPIALGAVLIGGYPIFKSALLGLRARSVNVDLLMAIGIVAAASIGEFISAALLVLFIQVAHFLEGFTTDRARGAIRELIALAPTTARVERDGEDIEIALDDLRVGDVVVIRPGEKIPADGVVLSGRSAVNQAPITGESIPVEKGAGAQVFAATLNELGSLRVRAERVGAETTLGRIIRMVERAESAKAPVQRFADRFTAYFLPVVAGAALLTLLISRNLIFTIAVLVVACPCAVALATPLSVVASVGSAARRGLLIKGGLYLEALAKVDVLLMDKTGTLTLGEPRITEILPSEGGDLDGDGILSLAAGVERYSEHVLASAVLAEARRRGLSIPEPDDFSAVPGMGVQAAVEGTSVWLGNRELLAAEGMPVGPEMDAAAAKLEQQGKTALFLARDGRVQGLLAVSDVLRPEVPRAIETLRSMGVRHLLLLTGDNERTAAEVARQLKVEYRAGLLPEDKIEVVRALQAQGHTVAMVGDGVNDAPALAQADVGIAMGAAGTDVALEAADVALMGDDWGRLPEAIRIGRRAFHTIKQNIAFGVIFNIVGIGLASVGILTPVLAAAAESLPDVAVFLNSSRLLRPPRT